MYNVFCDFHHASLLQSFIMLFEGRLGGNVYRPIGMEWAEQGYWKVYDHPATQQQFLTLNQGYRPIDGTPPLNQFTEAVKLPPHMQITPGVYFCNDIDSGQYNKAVTLEAFFKLPIDIVIASLPYHIEPFKRLCELHPNKPKLIYQIGNAWTVEAGLAPNVMASALIHNLPPNIHFISYHQEFSQKDFYAHEAHAATIGGAHCKCMFHEPEQNIYSFVNVFNGQDHFAADWQLFQQVEAKMLEWNFKSFGGQCRDGAIGPSNVLGNKMREAKFIWHTKYGGDGYGHVIHNAMSVGRPLIIKKEYYRGKMADALLEDGVTCITIDGLGPDEIVAKIKQYSAPEVYYPMTAAVRARFEQVVDFNKEAKDLQLFLENLL
jgi:hypothetical protein